MTISTTIMTNPRYSIEVSDPRTKHNLTIKFRDRETWVGDTVCVSMTIDEARKLAEEIQKYINREERWKDEIERVHTGDK